jgi:hypothetical protein
MGVNNALIFLRYNIGGSGWANVDIGNFRYGADVER